MFLCSADLNKIPTHWEFGRVATGEYPSVSRARSANRSHGSADEPEDERESHQHQDGGGHSREIGGITLDDPPVALVARDEQEGIGSSWANPARGRRSEGASLRLEVFMAVSDVVVPSRTTTVIVIRVFVVVIAAVLVDPERDQYDPGDRREPARASEVGEGVEPENVPTSAIELKRWPIPRIRPVAIP